MFDDRDDDISLDRRALLVFLKVWMFYPTIFLFVAFLSAVITVSVERAIILVIVTSLFLVSSLQKGALVPLMILRPTIVAILALFVVLLVVLLIRQHCLDFSVEIFIPRL